MSFETPIAFFIFNRPDTTSLVWEKIAQIRPKTLIVISDGARNSKTSEATKVEQTRKIISNIDWECDLKTNFALDNMGCKSRISSGLDWVFSQVEEAIILEDDCLPDLSFFLFAKEMLDKYRENQQIGMISGSNHHNSSIVNDDASYYFTRYFHIWGWATWRDRWQKTYDVDIKIWPQILKYGWMEQLFENKEERDNWTKIFNKMHDKQIDTWDYQWFFANLISSRLSIVPKISLITNIGLGHIDATHTKDMPTEELPIAGTLKFPLKHPIACIRNRLLDEIESRSFVSPKRTILYHIKKKIQKLAKKFKTIILKKKER